MAIAGNLEEIQAVHIPLETPIVLPTAVATTEVATVIPRATVIAQQHLIMG